MRQHRYSISFSRPSAVLLLPLALWVLVWGGIQAGLFEEVLSSDDPVKIFNRLRGVLPLWAGFLALVIFIVKFSRQRSGEISFLGPLGFATVYGLVGLAASLFSPDGSVALYWAAAYLSVPLVLWTIVWGKDGLAAIHRIINLNWLIIILAVFALFTVALLYLNLGSLILTPSSWFDCSLYGDWRGNSWHDLSWGFLRPTGVARYSALAAILALGGLWHKQWRAMWVILLLVAIILLLTSGARGAYLGFAASAVFVILFYGGKRAAVWGTLSLLVLVPVVWATGVHQGFVDTCIFRDQKLTSPEVQVSESFSTSPEQSVVFDLPIKVTIPPGQWLLEQILSDTQGGSGVSQGTREESESQSSSSITTGNPLSSEEETNSEVPARVLVPLALSADTIPLSQGQPASDTSSRIRIPPGIWQLKQLSPMRQAGEEQPLRIKVEPGSQTLEWGGSLVLEQLAPGETLDASLLIVETDAPVFLNLTGRTSVWSDGFELFKEQPILGRGFHADRLLLGTHMHNTFMHALIQTGLAGTIPLVVALLFGWVLLINVLRNRASLPGIHRHLIIQVAGVMIFFSFRAIPESTGAFFGVDWLFLAPILVYLQVLNRVGLKHEERRLHRAVDNVAIWKPVVSRLRKNPTT